MTNNWKEAPFRNREEILRRWLEAGLGMFLETMSPRSPAAEALRDAMETVLRHFAETGEERREGLESLTRIFAVQSIPPSRSLALFGVLMELLEESVPEGEGREACRRHVAAMQLEAFDCFMESRERIYRLKVEEAQSQMHMLLRRAVS